MGADPLRDVLAAFAGGLPPLTFVNIALGASATGLVAAAAGAMRALTLSGVLAALIIGFIFIGVGGLVFAAVLLAFFGSSTILSAIARRGVRRVEGQSGPRGASQVLANGAVGAVLILWCALSRSPRPLALLAVASIAAANADTWSTEIGTLFGKRPRLITTMRRAAPGVSGAVTLPGVAAAFLGSLFIAWIAVVCWPSHSGRLIWAPDVAEVFAITWAGFVAALADSILGASLQVRYKCERCGAVCEAREHCGTATLYDKGVRWMTNDMVNLIACALGAMFAYGLIRFTIGVM